MPQQFQTPHTTQAPFHRCQFESWFAPLPIQFPAKAPEKAKEDAPDILQSATHRERPGMEFLGPGFNQAQTWYLWTFREKTSNRGVLSPFLSLSGSAFQINFKTEDTDFFFLQKEVF